MNDSLKVKILKATLYPVLPRGLQERVSGFFGQSVFFPSRSSDTTTLLEW